MFNTKANLLISEHLKFKKEFIDARVQAYVEACRQIAKYPDRVDAQEFAADSLAWRREELMTFQGRTRIDWAQFECRVWKRRWKYLKLDLGSE